MLLRREILRHISVALATLPRNQGALSDDKEAVRLSYRVRRLEILSRNRRLVEELGSLLESWLAHGKDIDPSRIDPELVPIRRGTREAGVYRLASLSWSVPVSDGYGRRLRFLVRDRMNGKIIGLLAIGDPVFNLRVRDKWIGWDAEDRMRRLRYVMDAFVVGALPPYSLMLGGKLLAALLLSSELRLAFRAKYRGSTTTIEGEETDGQLYLITTSSALGRSSLYNRVRVDGHELLINLGFTEGYGHFHLPQQLFERLRVHLRMRRNRVADSNRFGQGPNWKMRVIREGLESLGLDGELLKHGIQREVFAVPLAHNTRQLLRGEQSRPRWRTLPVAEITKLATERWLIPRSQRDGRYRDFVPKHFTERLHKEVLSACSGEGYRVPAYE